MKQTKRLSLGYRFFLWTKMFPPETLQLNFGNYSPDNNGNFVSSPLYKSVYNNLLVTGKLVVYSNFTEQ